MPEHATSSSADAHCATSAMEPKLARVSAAALLMPSAATASSASGRKLVAWSCSSLCAHQRPAGAAQMSSSWARQSRPAMQ